MISREKVHMPIDTKSANVVKKRRMNAVPYRQLVRKARKGDTEAREALTLALLPVLRGMAYRILGTQDRDDGTNEAVLKILENLHRVSTTRTDSAIKNCLTTIGVHRILDLQRQRKLDWNRREDMPVEETPEIRHVPRDESTGTLPLPLNEVLTWCLDWMQDHRQCGSHLEGRVVQDYAKAHGCTTDEAKATISDAQKEYRELVKDQTATLCGPTLPPIRHETTAANRHPRPVHEAGRALLLWYVLGHMRQPVTATLPALAERCHVTTRTVRTYLRRLGSLRWITSKNTGGLLSIDVSTERAAYEKGKFFQSA